MSVARAAAAFTRRQLVIAATTGLAVLSATGASRPAAARQTPVANVVGNEAALRDVVETFIATTGTPGAMAGIWQGDAPPWLHAAGVNNLEAGTPLTPGDAFRIASVTKTFTATVVLQLVEEGLLNLDDVVETWVPDVPNGDTATIRNLLGMTSGIFNWIEAPGIEDAFNDDPLLPFSPEAAIDIAREYPPYFAPGEGFHYTETNYFLLGIIAEAVTNTSIATLITDRIITPLGLDHTIFATTPNMPEPFSHGYFPEADGEPPRDVTIQNPDFPWTAGAMISTLDDLHTWARTLANGDLLDPTLQAQRLEMTTLVNEPVYLGYGLGIVDMAGFLGHNGGIIGYSTYMVHDPHRDLTIVTCTNLSTNAGGGADDIFYGLVRVLFPDEFPPPAATPAA